MGRRPFPRTARTTKRQWVSDDSLDGRRRGLKGVRSAFRAAEGCSPLTLANYLKELVAEDTPLRHSELLQLSGLSSEELAEFKAAWASLSQMRKCDVLTRLVELSEQNLELDFSTVFRASLADDGDDVRVTAARGLWESDDRVIIRPLIEMLKNDPSPKVRAAAAVSLGKFAEMAQEGKVLSRDADRIREALLHAIGDEEDRAIRGRAIEAVASFNSGEIQEIISEAYRSGDQELKQSAIFAMGRSSDGRWLRNVLDEVHHEDPSIRYEAANALGQLGDESTVPHLITLIKDEDSEVQVSAVQALGSIGGPLARRALVQCLKMEDEAIEEAAQSALNNVEFDEDPLGFSFQA